MAKKFIVGDRVHEARSTSTTKFIVDGRVYQATVASVPTGFQAAWAVNANALVKGSGT